MRTNTNQKRHNGRHFAFSRRDSLKLINKEVHTTSKRLLLSRSTRKLLSFRSTCFCFSFVLRFSYRQRRTSWPAKMLRRQLNMFIKKCSAINKLTLIIFKQVCVCFILLATTSRFEMSSMETLLTLEQKDSTSMLGKSPDCDSIPSKRNSTTFSEKCGQNFYLQWWLRFHTEGSTLVNERCWW